ncbi:MAG: hypothetical protein ACK4GN_12720 [Runella sp.]
MRLFRFLTFIIIFCQTTDGIAQRPKGLFLNDSMAIGMPVQYALSFRHSPRVEVFFPDTATAFRPFEVIAQRYFPTQTDASGSLDSAVYTLVCFDLAILQKLTVPVWVKNGRDCTAIYTLSDTIFLQPSVSTQPPDSLMLRADTQIIALRPQPNFPYFLVILVLLILVGVIIYWSFGEALTRQWRLYKVFLKSREFKRGLGRLLRDMTGKKEIENAEKALILWKKYLQGLERKPFVTYTTKEIIDSLPDEALADALRMIDGVIYGGVSMQNLPEAFEILHQVANQVYQKRRAELTQKNQTPPAVPKINT